MLLPEIPKAMTICSDALIPSYTILAFIDHGNKDITCWWDSLISAQSSS